MSPGRAHHKAPTVPATIQQAKVMETLSTHTEGLTGEEIVVQLRHHLSRVQVLSTLTLLRKQGKIERMAGGPYNPSRWRLIP